jgi:hypothetical protein
MDGANVTLTIASPDLVDIWPFDGIILLGIVSYPIEE